MPIPYCDRYHELRQAWETIEVRLNLAGQDPGNSEERNLALSRLRAHAEICEDCIGAFWASFPETAGKARIMIDVMGSTEES